MAFLLGCEKVRVDFPTKRVFDGLSLGVDAGDRIGVVGRNGDGKSTLLRLLSGGLAPEEGFEEGRVVRTHGVTVGVLGQADSLDDADTIGHAVVGDAPEYEWAGNARTRDVLAGLLGGIPWDGRVGELSGGQRRRVDLARLLVGDWDVLMLDEPTNHLDVRGIAWLARHLRGRWRDGAGALLVVTHDRWFLDEVATSMWEVHDGRVEPFEGGFSAYVMQRVERERLRELAEQKRQNQLRRELAWLSRGARARATKPKFHVEAARALIADVPELRNPLELKRMAAARIGKQVVDLDRVTVGFSGPDGRRVKVLDDVTWAVGPGDRYGIVGENGAGKTTLLEVLRGARTPDAGRVKIGKTVKFALLSQQLDELSAFDGDRVRELTGRIGRRTLLDGKEASPAQLLERLGFTRDDLNERVGDLSGGQRRRLALMLILLEEANVLVLDEPGNDMDVDMLAVMEDMLDEWPGTLVLVTHDRYLMERVTDDQFALIDGKLRHLPRGIDEYLEIAAAQGGAGSPGAVDGAGSGAAAPGSGASAGAAAPRLSGGEIHRLRKLMQSNEGKTETLRGKIAVAEAAMAEADPSDYQTLSERQDEIAECRSRIDELELEWFDAAERLGLL